MSTMTPHADTRDPISGNVICRNCWDLVPAMRCFNLEMTFVASAYSSLDPGHWIPPNHEGARGILLMPGRWKSGKTGEHQ